MPNLITCCHGFVVNTWWVVWFDGDIWCVWGGGGVRVQWMNPGVCLLVAMTAAFLIIGYL